MRSFRIFALPLILSSLVFAFVARASEPTRKPVEIVIPQAKLDALSPAQREDVARILELLKDRLYNWSQLDIDLPVSAFGDGSEVIPVSELLKVPASDEVARIGQERRRLNEEQIAQLGEEAIFKVPSVDFPGRFHVWKVNIFFQKGAKNIRASYEFHKNSALKQLVVSVPARIWGEHPLSIRRGLDNFRNAALELISLAVGLDKSVPTYDQRQIDALVDQARREYALANPNGRDLQMVQLNGGGKENNEILNRLDVAVVKASQAWQKAADSETDAVIGALRTENLSSDEFFKRLSDQMSERRFKFITAFIAQNRESLGLSEELTNKWLRQTQAVQMIQQAEEAYAKGLEAEADNFRQTVKTNHPWLSLNDTWLEKQVERQARQSYQAGVRKFYEGLATNLRESGFEVEAQSVIQDVQYLLDQGQNVATELAEQQEPVTSFVWDYQIWRKDRWSVVKTSDGRFQIVKHTVVTTDTQDLVWRLQNATHRTLWLLNNGLYATLVTNLLNGPVGLKSLVKRDPFAVQYAVAVTSDPNEVPAIVPSGPLRGTMRSRMAAARAYGQSLIDQFENRKQFGFFGKGFERFLLFLKADLGYKLLAPAAIALTQTTATTANVAISGAITATSLAWAPLASLTRLGFDATIADLSIGSRSRRFGFYMPQLVPSIRQVVIGSVAAAETAVSAGFVGVHPGLAGAEYVYGLGQLGLRSVWDGLWLKAMQAWAHVPGEDSWIARRIQGPGVDSDYFFQVKPQIIWATLLAGLEEEALNAHVGRMRRLIDEPSTNANQVLSAFEAVFGSVGKDGEALREINSDRKKWMKVLNDLASERREKILENLEVPNGLRNRVRVSAADFDTMIDGATKLVRNFVELNLFAVMSASEIRDYWLVQNLQPNDWSGLAKLKVAERLTPSALKPLDGSGDSFVIQIDQPDFEQLISRLLGDQLAEPPAVIIDTDPTTEIPKVEYKIQVEALLNKACSDRLISIDSARLD